MEMTINELIPTNDMMMMRRSPTESLDVFFFHEPSHIEASDTRTSSQRLPSRVSWENAYHRTHVGAEG